MAQYSQVDSFDWLVRAVTSKTPRPSKTSEMVNLGAGDADAHADVDFDADGDYAYSPGEASECLPLDYEDFDSEDECPLAYLPPACDPSTHPQSHGETEEAGESAHQRTNT